MFREICLNNITLKNKVIRSATSDYMGNLNGSVSENQLNLYSQLAKNGIGMIITGHCAVCPSGRADNFQNALWDDCFIEGHYKLTECVHLEKGLVVAQISHAGAKSKTEEIPLSPSGVRKREYSHRSQAMTLQEIWMIKEAFIETAGRVKTCGYDGVQVHCAHGYLLSEFLSSDENRREDSYGGTMENRFRLILEIIKGIKCKCGHEYPVFLKIDANSAETDFVGYEDNLIYISKKCEELGIEAIEWSGYDFAARQREDSLYYLENVLKIKKKCSISVILTGGIHSKDDIEFALHKGIDMVALARPFICQPNFLNVCKQENSSKCIHCNQCFTLWHKIGKRCVLHP